MYICSGCGIEVDGDYSYYQITNTSYYFCLAECNKRVEQAIYRTSQILRELNGLTLFENGVQMDPNLDAVPIPVNIDWYISDRSLLDTFVENFAEFVCNIIDALEDKVICVGKFIRKLTYIYHFRNTP